MSMPIVLDHAVSEKKTVAKAKPGRAERYTSGATPITYGAFRATRLRRGCERR